MSLEYFYSKYKEHFDKIDDGEIINVEHNGINMIFEKPELPTGLIQIINLLREPYMTTIAKVFEFIFANKNINKISYKAIEINGAIIIKYYFWIDKYNKCLLGLFNEASKLEIFNNIDDNTIKTGLHQKYISNELSINKLIIIIKN